MPRKSRDPSSPGTQRGLNGQRRARSVHTAPRTRYPAAPAARTMRGRSRGAAPTGPLSRRRTEEVVGVPDDPHGRPAWEPTPPGWPTQPPPGYGPPPEAYAQGPYPQDPYAQDPYGGPAHGPSAGPYAPGQPPYPPGGPETLQY